MSENFKQPTTLRDVPAVSSSGTEDSNLRLLGPTAVEQALRAERDNARAICDKQAEYIDEANGVITENTALIRELVSVLANKPRDDCQAEDMEEWRERRRDALTRAQQAGYANGDK